MAWIAAKTDWDATDYYNYGDVNRVESNTDYLDDYITTNIGAIPATTGIKMDWDNMGIPDKDDFNKLEGNVQALRNCFAGDPTGWVAPKITWVSLDKFDYSDANRLETDLSLLKTMSENVVAAYLFCGNFICGEGTEF
ncbi:MAG: hypothetical protein WA125_17040 [Desulfosporosinus sp.]